MRLLGDVNIAAATIQALRARGFDVLALTEVGLHRLQDVDILAQAAREGRSVVTFDRRFTTSLALFRMELPSVIVLSIRDQTPASATPKLLSALEQHREVLDEGAIVIVDDDRTRVRRLPLTP